MKAHNINDEGVKFFHQGNYEGSLAKYKEALEYHDTLRSLLRPPAKGAVHAASSDVRLNQTPVIFG